MLPNGFQNKIDDNSKSSKIKYHDIIKTSETVAFNIFGKGLLEAASTSSKQLLRFYTQTKLWMRLSSLKASAKYLQCTEKLTKN